MIEYSYIGKSVVNVDAYDKVTGRAKYTTEEALFVPGILHGKVLFSPHAHANIVSIDTSEAMKVKGVEAIFTGKDTPDHRAGLVISDRHVLCHKRVRFVGDAIALVVANTIEAAEAARDRIVVTYEVLPAVFDSEKALDPQCEAVVHPDLSGYARNVLPYMGNDLPSPNTHTHHKIRKGDVEKAFQEADYVVENKYTNDRIIPCQFEPYNATCYPERNGGVTVFTSARLFMSQRPLIDMFNLPPTKLRIRKLHEGGMFGMLARPERFAILATLKTGKPCKVQYTKEEAFLDGFNRLPKIIYIKDGVKKDGTLVAREIKVISNTGAYTDEAPLVIRNGGFHAVQYRIPNYKWDAYGVYTNKPSCGPMRGFGNAEVLWATEQHMDMDAEIIGMDPLEFRLKNTTDEGEPDVRGQEITSTGAKECLKRVADWIEWGKPSHQPAEPHIKIGKGIALGNKYTMADTASAVMVKVHSDGTIEAFHGCDECGQGLNTIAAQIVAEEFGVPLEKTKIVHSDTDRVPYDFGSASMRTTLYVGKGLIMACQDAKSKIFSLASSKLNASPDNIDIRNGKIFVKDSPERAIDIADLSLGRQSHAIGATHFARCLEEGGEIIGQATFWGHPSPEDPETGQGERLTIAYGYGAQAVEVAVDTETGVVKVLKIGSAFDAGKALNPKLCEGQIEGGAGMGVGSALYEGFIFDEKGNVKNMNMHDYKICSAADLPSGKNISSETVECAHPEGPYGAKGIAETSMCPTAPAIANAIYNAIGVRVNALPMTPERVWNALNNIENIPEL